MQHRPGNLYCADRDRFALSAGHGSANAVAIGLAQAQLAARFNRDRYNLIDHHACAIVSVAGLTEGVAPKAASLVGHLPLGTLSCLYDDQSVTPPGDKNITFTEEGKFSPRFKRGGVALSRQPGIKVSQVTHDIGGGANLLRRWRREVGRHGILCAIRPRPLPCTPSDVCLASGSQFKPGGFTLLAGYAPNPVDLS